MAKARLPSAFKPLWTPSRFKAFYGGRGSAKSQSVSLALTTMAREKPMRILCCREFQNSMKESSKLEIENRISECGFGSFFSSFNTEIVGKNGSTFLFAGLRQNPDSVKSMADLDIAWVEEAATVSKRSLGVLIPTVRKPGSELWFTWNPRFAKDPVDVMFRGEKAIGEPRAIVRRVNWYDNPWFPATLREEMLSDRARDPDHYAHTWLGEYQQSTQARVFHNWKVEAFETPANARFYFGADWGFGDPNVLVRCWIDGKRLFVDHEAVKSACPIVDTPALFLTIPGAKAWPIIADSSRPETIDYMKSQGFRVVPSTKGPGSIEDGVEFLKNYDIIVHPRCDKTADELSRYSYKVDKTTEEVLPVLDDKHNHVIDALRYAVETIRRSKPTRHSSINVMGR